MSDVLNEWSYRNGGRNEKEKNNTCIYKEWDGVLL